MVDGAQVVVLAGGLGARMLPDTKRVPKFLLPVAGQPFAHWLLSKLRANGFTEALLCIGHLGEQVEEFVGDGSRYGLNIDYARDGPELRGTGGALLHARAQLHDEFVVTYGDSYLPFDYLSLLECLARDRAALGAMALFHNRDLLECSNASLDRSRPDRLRVACYDKGRQQPGLDHIDYGALALRRTVIDHLSTRVPPSTPPGAASQVLPLGLDAMQSELADSGMLRAVLAPKRFYEIGSPVGRADLEAFLAQGPQ